MCVWISIKLNHKVPYRQSQAMLDFGYGDHNKEEKGGNKLGKIVNVRF